MKTHITLGIDPGIANTGLAIVKANGTRYSLITAETLKTKACDDTGKRLSIIHDENQYHTRRSGDYRHSNRACIPQQEYHQLSHHWRGDRACPSYRTPTRRTDLPIHTATGQKGEWSL